MTDTRFGVKALRPSAHLWKSKLPMGHKQIRQSDGGNGHSGQRSPEVRFGLGKTQASAIQVRISWRDLHGTLHHDAMMLAPGSHTVLLSAKGNNS